MPNQKSPKYQRAMVVARNIKRLRFERGWSQKILSLKIGYSQDWLERVEYGEVLPSFASILAMSRALEVPLWELFLDEQLSDKSEKRVLDFMKRYKLTPEQMDKWIEVGKVIFKGENKNV